MRSALVLNASFEPLSVVSAQRATCLVLAEKADLVEGDGHVLKVPFVRRAALSRRAIFARDDHRCQYCGERADSIDHVVPRSKGGPHTWENVAAACRPCNLTKRDRTPDEAGMRLARPCRAPRATAWVIVSVSGIPDTWRPYLPMAS
jgi:hypothetical protein